MGVQQFTRPYIALCFTDTTILSPFKDNTTPASMNWSSTIFTIDNGDDRNKLDDDDDDDDDNDDVDDNSEDGGDGTYKGLFKKPPFHLR